MKNEKMFYFNNQKGKIRQKYFILYFEFIIVLLKIDLVRLLILKDTRKLNNYESQIKLVIEVSGRNNIPHNINILNNGFYSKPSQVIVDKNRRYDCIKTCSLYKGEHSVILNFEDKIETCYSMFEGLEDIIEVDLSGFDASGVVNMSYMFEDCYNLRTINLGNINISLVENMSH